MEAIGILRQWVVIEYDQQKDKFLLLEASIAGCDEAKADEACIFSVGIIHIWIRKRARRFLIILLQTPQIPMFCVDTHHYCRMELHHTKKSRKSTEIVRQ